MSYRPHKRIKGTRLQDMCIATISRNLDKVWVGGKGVGLGGREVQLKLELKRKVLEHLRGDPVMLPLPRGFLDEEWAEGGVDLSLCELPEGLLAQVGEEVPGLRSISLRQCSGVDMLKPEGFEALCMGCRRLRCLDMVGVMTMSDRMLHAAHKLCASLRTVRLGGCVCLTPGALAGFVRHAGHNLLELDLSGCPIDDHVVREVAARCGSLESLSVCYCDDVSHMAWCALLRARVGLKVLRMGRVAGVTDPLVLIIAKHQGGTLEELDIAGCGLVTDESVGYLSYRCQKLKKLSLRYCAKVSDTTLERIPTLISGITVLTKFAK
uniref:F-box/LRR-repeat protein 15-like leucin rich repeat domain-containing protein n=1 Tax=Hemiselmis tepida TaxID=464990 RepID=A0A7S0W0F7_9CRYP